MYSFIFITASSYVIYCSLYSLMIAFLVPAFSLFLQESFVELNILILSFYNNLLVHSQLQFLSSILLHFELVHV
ncbi:MAG: hypothetical protein ACKPKO_43590, partial [Candidatus Fonsibacter sp.]